MIPLREKIEVLKTVFSERKNIFILIVVSILIYLLNAVIVQWTNLKLAATIGIFNILTTGFYYSVTRETFYTSIMISVLTGTLISILSYRSQQALSKKGKIKGFIPSLAVFLGLLAPGCASCGIGLAAVIGLGAAMASLPLKGLEISLIAIFLLVYSVNRTLVSFIVCETPIKTTKSKKRKK